MQIFYEHLFLRLRWLLLTACTCLFSLIFTTFLPIFSCANIGAATSILLFLSEIHHLYTTLFDKYIDDELLIKNLRIIYKICFPKNKCSKNFWKIVRKIVRSSHRRCSVKRGVLRNFAKLTGKHLCQSLFIKKETLAQMFFCEFYEISKRTFFTENFRTTASE